MKRWKKVFAAALAVTVILGTFAGCSKDKTLSETVNVEAGEGTLITKDPLTLSIFMHYSGNIIFKDDWEVFKTAFEKTNIKLTGVASQAQTDTKQSFNILMASGNLPDIIHSNYLDLSNQYGVEGALIPLNDLIDKYAPNIKKFFKEHPEVKKSVTAVDGNIYIIPFVFEGNAAEAWFIRKDWLDKLNLSVPKSVDELHDVLLAFKQKDPNGNGKKDEIPYFDRIKTIEDLLPLFGARQGFYADEKGKVHYGSYDPEYKLAMAEINKWYKEGLIDPEIFTRGSNARDELFGGNIGGVTHDWITSTGSYNDKYNEDIKGFELVGMTPPADINGKVWESTSRAETDGKGWGISSQSKYPEQVIKYFDFWFTEEGRRLGNFGVEGIHYTIENGELKFTDEVLNDKEPLLQVLQREGAQIQFGIQQDIRYESQNMSESVKKIFDEYTNGGFLAKAFPQLQFKEEEKTVIDRKWGAINTYMEEMRQKWFFGENGETVDNQYDQYISKLKSMGIDEVLSMYQKAYDRYTGK